MTLPDHEFDPDDNFRHAFDDEDDMDLDDTEALVWNLLVLINPGDEETALRQFAAYRDATGEAGAEPDQVLWTLKDAIDWTSGFYVDWKDTETFIDCVNQLAARYAIEIDWDNIGEAPNEALVNALSMMAPYGVAEKQALLEAPGLAERGAMLVALTEMELAREGHDGAT